MEKTILELFSGSKTVSRIFEAEGWESFTIDNNPRKRAALCCNIQDISINQLPSSVEMIWASPDCRRFSRAAAQRHWVKVVNKYRNYSYLPQTLEAHEAISMINATIRIINYYPGVPFIIENPIGRIHHTAAMKSIGHYRYAVNYADFGFHYSKETYLFSNVWLPFSTKKVSSLKPGLRLVYTKSKRSLVPPDLIKTILRYLF